MVSYSTNEPSGSAGPPGSLEVPLFLQIAAELERDILSGALAEGSRAPSTTEIAAFHRINPATALKGVNHLVSQGILYKKRGLGMFVTEGAREQLLTERRAEFGAMWVAPLITQAEALGLSRGDVARMILEGVGA